MTAPPAPVIRTVRLSRLRIDPRLRLDWPAAGENRGDGLSERFPGLPLILIDPDLRVVWGVCRLELLRKRGCREAEVLQVAFPAAAETLMTGFNLLQTFFRVNLYEKLNFAALALEFAPPEEIRRRTGLDIPLDSGLIRQLPLLLGDEFRPLLRNGKMVLPTARELAAMTPPERRPLTELLDSIPFTASQGRRLVEMTREIAVRDGRETAAILEQCAGSFREEPSLRAADILSRLETLRFPMSAATEAEWRRRVEALELPPEVRVSHAPFFEPPLLEIRWQVRNLDELQQLAALWRRKEETPGTGG